MEKRTLFKLIFFVPEQYLESVKAAVFLAGAGRIGDYDQCCWQSSGQGQFRPCLGASPFIGDKPKSGESEGTLTLVDEYRIEMVCAEYFIKQSVAELKRVHPYEEPAYEVYRLEEF